MRIVVFGANGRTGRLLVGQALAGGHEVVAVTRHPEQIPSRNRLAILGGDVTDTAAVDPGYRASDSVIFTRLMEPLFMRLPGRTLYADNRRMEELIRASSLDWTIVRACWLFNSAAMGGYQVIEGAIRGMFTARGHLAACLLDQLADDRYIRKTIGIVTPSGTPSVPQQIWREAIRNQED